MQATADTLGLSGEEHSPIESNPPLRRAHSISREKFIEVLDGLGSPAAGEAEVLADIPGRYGIDRGIALAFFVHESRAGKVGICRDYRTRNWGNLRRPQQAHRGSVIQTRGGQFAKYVSWAAGLEDWCELLVDVYAGRWGLSSLGEVLRKYAPKADQNEPEVYARKVVQHVRGWQGEMRKAGGQLARALRYVTVMAEEGLNIRQGPGTSFPVAGKLPRGERVLVGAGSEGWLWLADGRGFIAEAYTREG